MKKKIFLKEKISYIWGILFLVVVIGFAFLSGIRLIWFYTTNQINYNERTEAAQTAFEADYMANFYGKKQFINIHGGISNVLGQRQLNGVTKLNNGYLVTLMEPVAEEKVTQEAAQAKKLKDEFEKNGIDFLYVMTPYTVNKYDTQLPLGMQDVGNQNADKVLEEMKANGINCLDIREKIYESGMNHYDLMYKTDHHWNEKGGFFAYQQIAKSVEKQLDIEWNPKYQDINNYETVTYEAWHLGSNGQRTGIMYAGIDDFSFLLPKFDTCLQREGTLGDFKEIFICEDALQKTDYNSRYTYDTTFDTIGHFINENAENSIKAVLVCDSMGRAMIPYLALSMKELKVLDAYSISNISLQTVEEYQPDIVIFMHYPGIYEYGNLFVLGEES